MSDFNTREFEIGALAFLLKKPQFFAQKKSSIKGLSFDDKKVQTLFKQLGRSFDTYQEFPTKNELKENLKGYLTDKAQYLDIEWQEYEDLISEIYSREVTGNTGERINMVLADQQRRRLVDKLSSAPIEELSEVAKAMEGDLKSFRRLHYQDVDLGLDFFGNISKVRQQIADYNDGICFPVGFEHLDAAMKGGTRKGELNCILGSTGTGKAQPLGAKIVTPQGMRRMGDIQVGDEVFDWEGNPVKVLGVFPQGTKKVYRVTFSDGTHTECCDEHLWWVRNFSSSNKGYKVMPLKAFMGDLKSAIKDQGERRNYQVPVCSPVRMSSKDHYIDPYVLGCVLGDGSIIEGCVGYSCAELELVELIKELLPAEITLNEVKTSRKCIPYNFVKTEDRRNPLVPNPYKEELKRLGLFGMSSGDKFVPEEYLFGSVEQRLALLQGLMDTDGHACAYRTRDKQNEPGPGVDYCCKSIKLVLAVEQLVRSLGGLAWRQPSKFVDGKEYPRTYFTLPLCPFRLPRKIAKWSKRKNKLTKMVDSVEFIREEECQCLQVASPTASYLTDDFIVTHNTTTLLNFSKGFLQNGARVVHIYLDSLEEEMAVRMATCWLGVEIEYGTDLDQIEEMLTVFKDQYKGRFFTKQFPGHSLSAQDVDEFLTNLKSYLYQQDKEAGLYEDQCGVIDIVVIDYIDLMIYDGNVEGFMVDEHKAGELNAVAIKHKVGIWTGTQGGTAAMKSDKPKLYEAHGYKSRFHPMANILIVCCPEEERLLLRRYFTFDFGKARRPVAFPSIPFVMDVVTQTIYEDPERVPKIKTGNNTPDQTDYQVNGTPAAPLGAAETAGAFV